MSPASQGSSVPLATVSAAGRCSLSGRDGTCDSTHGARVDLRSRPSRNPHAPALLRKSDVPIAHPTAADDCFDAEHREHLRA